MKITEKKLRKVINEEIKRVIEARVPYAWEKMRAWPGERSIEDEEELEKDDRKTSIKRGATPSDTHTSSSRTFEEEIDELRGEIEYSDIDTFAEFKLNNDENSYSTTDLQALARNVDYEERGMYDALPPSEAIRRVKEELASYGLKFEPRQPQRHFRGSMSAAHGANRFAGTGAGGSGFSSGGLGLGTGPGAIGASKKKEKVVWSPSEKGSLPMGSRRR